MLAPVLEGTEKLHHLLAGMALHLVLVLQAEPGHELHYML
jgi:hypothetical protein